MSQFFGRSPVACHQECQADFCLIGMRINVSRHKVIDRLTYITRLEVYLDAHSGFEFYALT